ncbi:MAG: CvpA family protein [Bacteroidetes bacterium]|jgi:membrane protein required for colicin V production|nr:CvpA family protein [Bacteroidota bacterium]MBT5527886.1 CvpA family protein [Cytophagia bacterium]MBT3424903.1 CvpA family protein [Bacteroidota bacterium]MBT3801963.1 CvpA family protein [Bacteroidota bacterium]MBT3933941.1 CvpA family protein [Bacteroidota bacterium]
MNTLDIIFLIPLLYFLITGFRKGLIIEVLSVLAFIIAIIGAMQLSNKLLINSGMELNSKWLPYIAYIVVFLGIFLAIITLAKLLQRIIKTAQLNIFNRLAGALFGFVKVVLLFSLLLWITDQVDVIPAKMKNESISYRYLEPVSPQIISFFTGYKEDAKGSIEQVEDFFENIANSL